MKRCGPEGSWEPGCFAGGTEERAPSRVPASLSVMGGVCAPVDAGVVRRAGVPWRTPEGGCRCGALPSCHRNEQKEVGGWRRRRVGRRERGGGGGGGRGAGSCSSGAAAFLSERRRGP